MIFLQVSTGFSWKEILLGGENWTFLPETALRTLIMFIVILCGLRILGKRGVKQLSVFELVVIIGLGSAAGDPMMYKDVGILPALVVFTLVISAYMLITYFIGKNKKFETLVEGKPVCLIQDGMFAIDNFKKEPLGEDEFFSELRMKGVSQLGQVEQAIVESCGSISVFFYADDEVKYGLPVLPGSLEKQHKRITETGYYSCVFCGYTKQQMPAQKIVCPGCKRSDWVKSSNRKRVG
jgi:uncharacterized membrane protein YcaP (DUF421 family)